MAPARLANLVTRDPYLTAEKAKAQLLLADAAEEIMQARLDEGDEDAARWMLERIGRSQGYDPRQAAPNLQFVGGKSAIMIKWEGEE